MASRGGASPSPSPSPSRFEVRVGARAAVVIDRTTQQERILPGYRDGPKSDPMYRYGVLRGKTLSSDGRWLALWGVCVGGSGSGLEEAHCDKHLVMVWDLDALTRGQLVMLPLSAGRSPTMDYLRVTSVTIEGEVLTARVTEKWSDCSSRGVIRSIERWSLTDGRHVSSRRLSHRDPAPDDPRPPGRPTSR